MPVRTAVLAALTVLVALPAWARPPHKQSLKNYYGRHLADRLGQCTTCHQSREESADPSAFDEHAPPHNIFGERLMELGVPEDGAALPPSIADRLATVAAEDTDGDGALNELEILSGHRPGDIADMPTTDELNLAANTQATWRAAQPSHMWRPFEPIRRPAVPNVNNSGWVRNPIDAFIAAEHERLGLKPQPEASKTVMLRRLYLDVVGLPPSRSELLTYLSDAAPDAYERAVDRLLASPHYGERWGRHWMDVWRYSDWAGWTDGKQIRDSQPHIWRWRDWIVESLNRDAGYDQLVTDMLAADELWPTDASKLRATGFLARNYKMLSRETWMQDTVHHTLQAFLGLTVGCARCHNHMYDSITQEEYYRVRAIFEPHHVRLDMVPGQADTTIDGLPRVMDDDPNAVTYLFERGDDRAPVKDRPLAPGVLEMLGPIEFRVEPVPLPVEAWNPALAPHATEALLAAARASVTAAEAGLAQTIAACNPPAQADQAAPAAATNSTAVLEKSVAERTLATARAQLASLEARLAAERGKVLQPPAANVGELTTAAAQAQRQAELALADEALAKGELTLAQAQAAAAGDPSKQQAATDAQAMLTELRQKKVAAQAAVGQTTNEYQVVGQVFPTTSTGRRSALARWITDKKNPLAARVAVNQIWLRHMGQALVPTVLDFGQNGRPPSNPALVDWLAAEFMEPTAAPGANSWSMKHLHRLILTSSTYRMASTSETTNDAIDPENHWLWRSHSRRVEAEIVRDAVLYVAGQLDLTLGGPDLDLEKWQDVKRRSMYFRHAQEKQMEFLKIFDCASVSECYQRKESIVPQQALALANSELTWRSGRLLARRLTQDFADRGAFVTSAFQQVLSRSPQAEEQATCQQFVEGQLALYAQVQDRLTSTAGNPGDVALPSADPELRARESLVHALLNHHDFVTIR